MSIALRGPSLIATVGLVLALAACGAEEAPGAVESARPAQEQITITPTDLTPFALQAGRYRFGWASPACKSVLFTLKGASQGFSYEKKSALPRFSSIISEVPSDEYTLSQGEPACTDWTITLDRIGN
jgi:hypothetical protein